MFVKFVENIGSRVIDYSISTYAFFIFLFQSLGNIFLPRNYGKSSRIIFVEQIYLSGIRNLFSFIFLALFLGSALLVLAISFSISFNLVDQMGKLLILFVINEFSPFFTAIFFVLVYSLSLQEKIHDMKKEQNVLGSKVYIPKLITGLFIVPLMALLFATIMIASGYIVSSLYLNIDFMTYKNMIITSINFKNILVLLIKGAIFGFICVFIPLYSGHIRKSASDVTRLVIKNLIIILSMLILVESLFILILY